MQPASLAHCCVGAASTDRIFFASSSCVVDPRFKYFAISSACFSALFLVLTKTSACFCLCSVSRIRLRKLSLVFCSINTFPILSRIPIQFI